GRRRRSRGAEAGVAAHARLVRGEQRVGAPGGRRAGGVAGRRRQSGARRLPGAARRDLSPRSGLVGRRAAVARGL
ncbi:MAG: hypothetical protein AVDCRST_MAG50-1445, partial [uncultured Acidimicrobiales bacterium]